MIDFLDHLLRHLFRSRIPELSSDDLVRFQPPDQDWRNHVGTLASVALNVYLVSIWENATLRSNAVERQLDLGQVSERRAPRRLDCMYLATAWSPISVNSLFEPTPDEHALLYQVAAVLMNAEPLVPRRLYEPDPLPAGFPDAIADAELPSVILLADAFPKLAEFWGTVDFRWKPGVYFTITLPVVLDSQVAGPPVLTRIATYRAPGGAAEARVQIGGLVSAGAPAAGVAGAWVRLESPAGAALRTATTDADGHFTFAGLAPGAYTLRARATGYPEASRAIAIPSAPGGYDLHF
jgi:hypothetical protein